MEQSTDWWGTNVWDKNKSFYKSNNLINNNLQILKPTNKPDLMLLSSVLPIEISNERIYVNLPSQNVRDAHPTTKMRFMRSVILNQNGLIDDPSAVEMIGYWGNERIADMLPIDYSPENADSEPIVVKPKEILQRIYLHTNKPNYVASERIWFSAYLTENETTYLWKEPQPIYVQLFNPLGEATSESVLYSQGGRSNGYLQIPDSTSSGVYRLRAFTKLMRNWPATIFEKELIILNPKESINIERKTVTATKSNTDTLAIQILQNTIGKKKIEINLKSFSNDNPASGSFSVSVIDVTMVDKESVTIQSLGTESHYSLPDKMSYQKENGLSLKGRLFSASSKSLLKNHSILLILPDSVQTQSKILISDDNGYFELNGIDIDGTRAFAYQVTNAKGKTVPDAEIQIDPMFPTAKLEPLEYQEVAVKTKIEPLHDGQREIQLPVVEIKEQQPERVRRDDDGIIKIHSEASYAIDFDEKSPVSPNVYEMMMGRLPGLQVLYDVSGRYQMLIRGVGTLNNNSPLVILDGMELPIGSDLTSIVNPNIVRRIELLSGGNASAYGMSGGNGVIAIYTRRFMTDNKLSPNSKTLLFEGYQAPEKFYNADSQSDTKNTAATIYWNPEIRTNENGEATFPFFVPNKTSKYKIIIEGMTQSGKIGRVEAFIK
jgi:hypothetical protein